MLVSRLISQIRLTRSFAFSFAQYNSSRVNNQNPIHSKIYSSNSLEEFFKLFQENRSEFNADVLSDSSRQIIYLLTQSRQRLRFDVCKNFLQNLESINVAVLAEKTIVNLLSIIRTFKNKNIHNGTLSNLKNTLAVKYSEILKEKKAPLRQQLTDLLSAYFELSYFHKNYESKLVAERIRLIFEEGLKNGPLNLQAGNISFLFYVLSLKPELNRTEKRLRQIAFKGINDQLETIHPKEIVKIAISINKMDIFDFSIEEFGVLKQITNKICSTITQLDERQIYDLIKSDYVSKYPGFMRIYNEILNNVFAEIKDNGQSTLDSQAIVRIISHLSDKIEFYRFSEPQQKKFFAFLDKYAQDSKSREDQAKRFGFKLEEIIKNNFFSFSHRVEVIQLFKKYSLPMNLKLIYYFALKNTDIGFSIDFLQTFKLDDIHSESLYRLGYILNKLKNDNPDAAKMFEKVELKVAEEISTPQKFITCYKYLQKTDITVPAFFEAFGNVIDKLSNPYETEVEAEGYKYYYLHFIANAYKNKDLYQFFMKHEAKISNDELLRIINSNIYNDQRQIEPNRVLVQYVSKRAYSIFDSKDKKNTEILLNLVYKYNRFIVLRSLDHGTEDAIFKIIHVALGKMENLTEAGHLNYFGNLIDIYLSKNHKNYNIQVPFRNLLNHLLRKVSYFSERPKVLSVIINEGLRLGLIEQKNIEKLDIEKLHVGFYEKIRLNYIKDHSFTPKIERITPGALKVIFSNPNLEQLMISNENKIFEYINSVGISELFSYAVIFNHHKNGNSVRVLGQILNNIQEKVTGFERLDLVGFVNNAVTRGYFSIFSYRKLVEKIIENLTTKVYNFTIETHLEVIKLIITQPGLNPVKYYQTLIDYAEKRNEITDNKVDAILLRLANSNYRFKQNELKYVERILKKNVYQGLFYFLMLQSNFEPQYRKQIAQKIADELCVIKGKPRADEKDDEEMTLNSVYYHYFKLSYPEETKALVIDEANLYSYRFSQHSKNDTLLNLINKLAGVDATNIDQIKDNYLIRIKQYVFVFLHNRRIGSFYEHQFIKRAVPAILGESVTVVCLSNLNKHVSVLEYINKNCPDLFQKTEFQRVVNEIKEHKQKSREEESNDK